jgi:histidine triad (HIT) family protein
MSLIGAYDPDNIFAKILRGEIPAVKVFEDADVLAFMDLFPQSKGHTLVISKTSQARNFLEVAPVDLERLILGVQRVAKAVEAALNPAGLIVTQFNGAPAGQTVFHLHFHIIPRYEGVEVAGHGRSGMADVEVLKALAGQIGARIS